MLSLVVYKISPNLFHIPSIDQMCLITFAYHAHPRYKFILAANRDEFYQRPTAAAHWWEDAPEILGGKDLKAGGTWMGIHKNGRFAAVTNYRDLQNINPNTKSRGHLVSDFLAGTDTPETYAATAQKEGAEYNGFNLLLLDDDMAYASNYATKSYALGFGIYGLSNALLDTPWHKVTQAKAAFERAIQGDFELEALFSVMSPTDPAPDAQLPATGLDYAREKALSAIQIHTPDYGTCSTTLLTIDYEGQVRFLEKTLPTTGRPAQLKKVEFKIE